jgi:hypothetical protein
MNNPQSRGTVLQTDWQVWILRFPSIQVNVLGYLTFEAVCIMAVRGTLEDINRFMRQQRWNRLKMISRSKVFTNMILHSRPQLKVHFLCSHLADVATVPKQRAVIAHGHKATAPVPGHRRTASWSRPIYHSEQIVWHQFDRSLYEFRFRPKCCGQKKINDPSGNRIPVT